MRRAGVIASGAVVVLIGAASFVVLSQGPQEAVPLAVAPPPTPSAASVAPTPTPSSAPTATPSATARPGPVPPQVIDHGSRDQPKVALTFDAALDEYGSARLAGGYYPPQFNQGVIDYLQESKTPATVFVTGLWARQYPEELRKLAANPAFTIGNKTWDHRAWTADCYGLPQVFEPERKAAQVAFTADAIHAATNTWPTYFRFPGLCYTDEDVALVAEQGETVIGSDVSGYDAYAENPSSVVAAIMARVQPGSIILLNLTGAPNAPVTAEVVAQLIPALQQAGLQPVPLAELIAAGGTGQGSEPRPEPSAGYGSSGYGTTGFGTNGTSGYGTPSTSGYGTTGN